MIQDGGDLVSPEVADAIVQFVASAKLSPQDDLPHPEGEGRGEGNIEPALLSLVCSELNQRRGDAKQPQITQDLLSAAQDTIIQNFYQRGFAGLNPALQTYVEDHLLTRDSRAFEDALLISGVKEDALYTLVNRRLLRIEERYGHKRVELIHDRLAPEAQDSRDRRQRAEAEAEAKRQARQRRRRWLSSL
ncbi:MAG: hypothetical protein ACKN9T_14995 [Candidatus Methylumidiphilus sp.]